MEKTSKLLLHQNVTTIKFMDYQIIVAKPWLPDRSSVMTALSEQKFTILEPTNGTLLLSPSCTGDLTTDFRKVTTMK